MRQSTIQDIKQILSPAAMYNCETQALMLCEEQLQMSKTKILENIYIQESIKQVNNFGQYTYGTKKFSLYSDSEI
jgi:hypothetical protein